MASEGRNTVFNRAGMTGDERMVWTNMRSKVATEETRTIVDKFGYSAFERR